MFDIKDGVIWRAEVGARLRKAIKSRYGARQERYFADDVGVSQASISDICRGNTTPSAATLLLIDKNSSINVMQLLRG